MSGIDVTVVGRYMTQLRLFLLVMLLGTALSAGATASLYQDDHPSAAALEVAEVLWGQEKKIDDDTPDLPVVMAPEGRTPVKTAFDELPSRDPRQHRNAQAARAPPAATCL